MGYELSTTHKEKFLHRKGSLTLEQAAQGAGGVIITGGAKEMTGCGTQSYGLVDKVLIGHRFDLMIL